MTKLTIRRKYGTQTNKSISINKPIATDKIPKECTNATRIYNEKLGRQKCQNPPEQITFRRTTSVPNHTQIT